MKNSILEPIGMHARITESVNSELIDISGVIIDETKHMLKLNMKQMNWQKKHKLNQS